MFILEHKYVGLLSNRLERFTRVNQKTYTFRCPICGDSKRNSYKTRGYIYQKQDRMLYFCHNCGASMSFGNFLKTIDHTLHNEYMQERFMEKQGNVQKKEPDITSFKKPVFQTNSPLKTLKKISGLEELHPAKRYVVKRKIPPRFHHKLYFCPKFKAWINTVIPGKFKGEEGDEPRLIIPLIDKKNNVFGVQGRSFKPDGIRYITIMFDENNPKVFGLDDIDYDKPVYVVEGPIDSMFLENAIAMAGSDLPFHYFDEFRKETLTFVYDNEPRNKQIVKRMEDVIERGYNIVLWPEDMEQKDINDMVLAGLNPMSIIKQNTYSGLGAMMKLTQWKKI